MVFQTVNCENGHKYHAETTIGKDPMILTECPFCKVSVNVAGCQPIV